MKLVAVTAAVWAVIAIVWWLTVGAEVAKAQSDPYARWSQIASLYAGRPVTVGEDTRGARQATARGGQVLLGKDFLKTLTDWEGLVKAGKQGKAGKKKATAQNRAAVLGTLALSTLIHEAVHARDFGATATPGVDEEDWKNPHGFYASGNESQAAVLGSQLLPHMMERFFGVGRNTPFAKRMLQTGQNLGNYQIGYGSAQWGDQRPDDLADRFLRTYLP